jgi:hypothetical protein
MDEKTSTLYAAATESLVSESSANSTFEKMIQVAYTHSTHETFSKELKDTETAIKKDFEISSMPSPWRSAKSVLISAMKLDISLIDDNGGFVGKTYLQNKIKEKKVEDKDPPTTQEYADQVIKKMISVPEDVDLPTVLKLVKEYILSRE